jgi:signal transduction histidine kinase
MMADCALALLVSVYTYIRMFNHISTPALAVLLAGSLALALRRRMPGTVLTVTTWSLIVFAASGGAFIALPLACLIALYTVSARYSPRVSATAAAATFIAVSGATWITLGTVDDDVLDRLPLILGAWLVGYGSRVARERTALMEQKTAQLQREQAANTKIAVLEEQSRIARELHDIVGHHITVMVAQATAANRVAVPGPNGPRDVLSAIAASGRETLGELRGLLGALRPEEGQAGISSWPGLRHVPALIDNVERSGLPVELIVRGRPRPLPMSVELNAYRIIQEALTNSLKHAGPTTAEVELDYQPTRLNLRVSDEGECNPAPINPGYGVLGMVNRASLLGGKITVGPAVDHSFQVSAQLPVPEG